MKRTLRYGLLAGASGLALGFGLATAPAQAFDKIDWEWYADVKTDFEIDPDINWDVDPEGLVMVESIQLQVGNVKAYSGVYDVKNTQPEIEVDKDKDHWKSGKRGHKWDFGKHHGNDDELVPLNAVKDLPEVVSVATAVANNLSVTANAGTLMNNGQYAFGDFNPPEGEGDLTYASWDFEKEWDLWYKDEDKGGHHRGKGKDGETILSFEGSASGSGEYFNASGDLANAALAAAGISQVDTGNSHHDALATFTILGALGLIEQGTVKAESYVGDIYNASVDSNATAVSNNISVSVNPGEEVVDEETGEITVTPGNSIDNLLVADYTQFSYMNVNSNSYVEDVDVNNYTNLGKIDRPLVNSTATSVGNNISVNVGN